MSPGAASLYAHQFAAGQQGLIYGYPPSAMGKMPGGLQTDPMTGALIGNNDQATLQALGISAANNGMYSAAHLGVLSSLTC